MNLGTDNQINRTTNKNLILPITDITKINEMSNILRKQHLGKRNQLLFLIGINTGLNVNDYIIMRVGQFREIADRGYLILVSKKTNADKHKRIRIDISDGLREYIKEYISDKQDNEYMFASRKGGTPIKNQTVWTILSDAAEKVGIETGIGANSIRKTFGYWHYMQNHNLKLLMDIFQQSNPELTLQYIGMNNKRIKDSMINMSLGI